MSGEESSLYTYYKDSTKIWVLPMGMDGSSPISFWSLHAENVLKRGFPSLLFSNLFLIWLAVILFTLPTTSHTAYLGDVIITM